MKTGILLFALIALLHFSGCSGGSDNSDEPKPVAQALDMRL